MGNILCTLQLFIGFHKCNNKNTNTQKPQMFYCNRNFKVKVRAFIKRNLLTLQRHIGNSLYRVTRICLKNENVCDLRSTAKPIASKKGSSCEDMKA